MKRETTCWQIKWWKKHACFPLSKNSYFPFGILFPKINCTSINLTCKVRLKSTIPFSRRNKSIQNKSKSKSVKRILAFPFPFHLFHLYCPICISTFKTRNGILISLIYQRKTLSFQYITASFQRPTKLPISNFTRRQNNMTSNLGSSFWTERQVTAI